MGIQRVLLTYPRFTRNNLLGFEHMMHLFPGKKAVLPPLGLLELGALLRERGFEVRLVDENVCRLDENDWRWAHAVFVSGMHPQRARMTQILHEARRRGLPSVIGGPSASICPEYYPQADAVHVGEIGDATDALIDWLGSLEGIPPEQKLFKTEEKTALEDLPLPALDLMNVNDYFLMPIQFSVGCPYTCEFCDIPAIYGRVARVKSPPRVVQELDAIFAKGFVGTILFVDDNLIANKKALRQLLPAIIEWQKAHEYPYPLTSEATANISREPEILSAMRDARFTHIFVGVESPDPSTLKDISKKQNLQDPLIESLRVLNGYGIEIIAGMIFGFDTDTERTGELVTKFIGESNIPVVYFNLLAALPKTPLWARLEKEGRILTQEGDVHRSDQLMTCMTSNVSFKLPKETVQDMLRTTVREVYSPREVFRRFLWNAENVYGHQLQGIPPTKTREQQIFAATFAAGTFLNVIKELGVRADYREEFWKFFVAIAKLKMEGRIPSFLEVLLRCTPDAHHLITWGRVLLEEHGDAADIVPKLADEEPAPRTLIPLRTRGKADVARA